MKQDSRALSRPFLYFIFAISILALIFAVVLVAMLVAYGYIGFNTNSTGTIGTCLDNYFSTKYSSNLQNIEGAVFVCSVLALALSITIFVILLVWVVRVCKGGSPVRSISRKLKIALFILASFFVLMAIIPMGYHITYMVELGNCNNSNSYTDLTVLLAFAVLVFVFALLLWILLLCAYCKDRDADERYREVYSQTTEQNQSEKRKEPVNYRKQPEEVEKQKIRRQPIRKVDKPEETKDIRYESPKRPTQNVYAKEPTQHQTLHPASYSKYQSPSKNPPPVLEHRRRIPEESNLSFIPSRTKLYEPAEELVYSKPRRAVVPREDTDSRQQAEMRYLSKYGGTILPSSGVEERNNSRLASDYFRSPDPSRRRLGSSPPRQSDYDGVLVNHIRGKYAR